MPRVTCLLMAPGVGGIAQVFGLRAGAFDSRIHVRSGCSPKGIQSTAQGWPAQRGLPWVAHEHPILFVFSSFGDSRWRKPAAVPRPIQRQWFREPRVGRAARANPGLCSGSPSGNSQGQNLLGGIHHQSSNFASWGAKVPGSAGAGGSAQVFGLRAGAFDSRIHVRSGCSPKGMQNIAQGWPAQRGLPLGCA